MTVMLFDLISANEQACLTLTGTICWIYEFVSLCDYFVWPIQVHVNASECLLEIFKLYKQISPGCSIDVEFKGEVLHQYEVEKNVEAKSFLKQCIDILENLEVEKVQAMPAWSLQVYLIV